MTPIRRRLRLAAVPLAGLWLTAAQAAETAAPDRAATELQLRGVETNLKASKEEQRKIEADVEALSLDRGRLNAALLDTTAKLQKIEADRAEATGRLAKAAAEAHALEASFGERRARIAQLLAALQRMTHDAPPAIFVKPDDMAAAVRVAGVVNTLIANVKISPTRCRAISKRRRTCNAQSRTSANAWPRAPRNSPSTRPNSMRWSRRARKRSTTVRAPYRTSASASTVWRPKPAASRT